MSKRIVALAAASMFAIALVTPASAQQQPAQPMPGHDMPQHGHQTMDHGGPAAAIEDKRQTITLTAAERDFVLMEMRAFLDNVQGIVAAIADDKPKDAAKFARGSGMGATHGMPPGMGRKMPPEFRMLGMDTHKRFDALAMEADSMADKQGMMRQLAGLLANCSGCHAAYRIAQTP